ncbi:MAG: hypothetical protein LBJ67_13820 [Planctomycetaceae bacterium]|nr:hypothetical protein [Planctomycetaceae bacterium]
MPFITIKTTIKLVMFLGIFSASEVMMARKQAATIELSEQERGIFEKIVRLRTLGACLHDRACGGGRVE